MDTHMQFSKLQQLESWNPRHTCAVVLWEQLSLGELVGQYFEVPTKARNPQDYLL